MNVSDRTSTADGPPVLVPGGPPVSVPATPARWRSFAALALLSLYVVIPAAMGTAKGADDPSLLPPTTRGVLVLCASELAVFALVFGTAAALGRPGWDGLWLRWRGGWWVWPRALAWSVALRFAVGFSLAGALVVWQQVVGKPISDLSAFRPKVEAMVEVSALDDPVYLGLMLTLVSFVLAGLREELWRAGMLRFLGRALPAWFGGRWGPWIGLVPVAVLFGSGHTPQGWVGVVATTMLGLGLGALMLGHRSIWDAVLAHGFFNATTFALLPWLARWIPGAVGA